PVTARLSLHDALPISVARAKAAVSEALAREAQARANLLQAERMLARYHALRAQDSNFVSQQALEEAETEVRIQRELVEAARHGVDRKSTRLNSSHVKI